MRLVSERFGGNPKPLSQKAIRGYVVHLKEERGWAPSTLRQAVASMREFYAGMLGKDWKLWDVVKAREGRKLPVVLDVEGVRRVLASVPLMRHRTPLRLIYCCGLRLDEAVKLTVDDVERGRILVREGKGGKDRYVPLSGTMLGALRRHWLQHRNPKWLFPSAGRGHPSNARERMGKSDAPFGKGALQLAFHRAVADSGIRKKATIHTLRHSYATHLLAMGVNPAPAGPAAALPGPREHRDHLHLPAPDPPAQRDEERSMEHVEAIAKMTL